MFNNVCISFNWKCDLRNQFQKNPQRFAWILIASISNSYSFDAYNCVCICVLRIVWVSAFVEWNGNPMRIRIIQIATGMLNCSFELSTLSALIIQLIFSAESVGFVSTVAWNVFLDVIALLVGRSTHRQLQN